jgi:DNA-binding winged helix-turn-helix (wHTH) protein
MFLNHLYGGMDEPELKIIDVFICKLRKKLANASSGKNYIETVWGRGYVLREPVDSDDRITASSSSTFDHGQPRESGALRFFRHREERSDEATPGAGR